MSGGGAGTAQPAPAGAANAGIQQTIKPGKQIMENPETFNVRWVSRRDNIYRVYARGSDLYFIRLGGLSATTDALTMHFGLIGYLIRESMKRRAKKKTEELLQRAGQVDPEQLLRDNKSNFKLFVPEVREAVIEPPALFARHGRQAGRWNVFLQNGKKMRFEFENTDELKVALNVLPQLMNATLRINVEWDETKKRFQKKKMPY
jgi:hypothetical protein